MLLSNFELSKLLADWLKPMCVEAEEKDFDMTEPATIAITKHKFQF
jgi:hypothetical protein